MMNKHFYLFSLLASLPTYTFAAVDCKTPPTCSELGYTENAADCVGKKTLCPFDKEKGVCLTSATVGEIAFFPAGKAVPYGWIKADGYIHSPAVYPDLYQYFGETKFGTGSLTMNFGWFQIPAVASVTGTTAYIYAGKICEDCKSQHLTGCTSSNIQGPFKLVLQNGIYKCIYASASTNGRDFGRFISVSDNTDCVAIGHAVTAGYQSSIAYATNLCVQCGLSAQNLSNEGSIHKLSSTVSVGTYYTSAKAGDCYAYGNYAYKCTSPSSCSTGTCSRYKAFCAATRKFAKY